MDRAPRVWIQCVRFRKQKWSNSRLTKELSIPASFYVITIYCNYRHQAGIFQFDLPRKALKAGFGLRNQRSASFLAIGEVTKKEKFCGKERKRLTGYFWMAVRQRDQRLLAKVNMLRGFTAATTRARSWRSKKKKKVLSCSCLPAKMRQPVPRP